MWLKQIEFRNFRNLEDRKLTLDRDLVWFVGENGQGKTNLLEAAYFLLTNKSFRTHKISDLKGPAKGGFEVSAVLKKGNAEIPLQVVYKGNAANQRFIGSKPCKVLDLYQLTSILDFTARAKNFVEGSPVDRRRFLDRMISYLDFDHLVALSRYKKILSQLKSILYSSRDLNYYKSFKKSAVPVALKIVSNRINFIKTIQKEADLLYSWIFATDQPLSLTYRLRGCTDMESYGRRMIEVSAQEILSGKSLVGPHIDDLSVGFDHRQAKAYASSGQIRGMVLSVILAFRNIYQQRFGSFPIILLDDIDAELDLPKLARLLEYLGNSGQSLISSSKYGTIGFPGDGVFNRLKNGRIFLERNS